MENNSGPQPSDPIGEVLESYGYWFGDKIRGQTFDTPHMNLVEAHAAIEQLFVKARLDELKLLGVTYIWNESTGDYLEKRAAELQQSLKPSNERSGE